MKKLLVSVLVLFCGNAYAEHWNRWNDPVNFSTSYEYHFSALPTAGNLPTEKMPWSETYWPAYRGSIDFRWNSPAQESFGYASPSKAEVLTMTRARLMQLSPAEKYDLAMGHYDYPLKAEVYTHASPDSATWEGICHGWSPAAIQFREPKPVDFVNPDGIVIPFGSSDVKGLLSYFMAFHADEGVVFAGLRCKRSDACSDVNAGAMHVIVANELGLRHQGFVADVNNGKEVWNQPIYGYKMTPTASTMSSTEGGGVDVKLELLYVSELYSSQWLPTNGTAYAQFDEMSLFYNLELDSDGKIVGGTWKGNSFPDFLWKTTSDAHFDDVFAGMAKIYQPN